jgi:hypothetical protein
MVVGLHAADEGIESLLEWGEDTTLTEQLGFDRRPERLDVGRLRGERNL